MAVRSKIEGLLPPRGSEAVKRAVTYPTKVALETTGKADHGAACPQCGWDVIDRAHAHGVFDGMMRLVRLRPYRCRRCYHRFYGRAF